MNVPRDHVRRPVATVQHVTTTDNGLRDISGWEILALYMEGRITAEQAQHVNSMRVRMLSGERKRAA